MIVYLYLLILDDTSGETLEVGKDTNETESGLDGPNSNENLQTTEVDLLPHKPKPRTCERTTLHRAADLGHAYGLANNVLPISSSGASESQVHTHAITLRL